MGEGNIRTQVLNGFKLAAKVLVGFFTAAAFWISVAVLYRHLEASPGSLAARFPELPWVLLLVSSTIMIVTVGWWVTILPGFMAYATIGGLIMLFTGHYKNLVVPRPIGFFLTLLGVVSAALAATFPRRQLNWLDRTALMGFVTCLAIGTSPKNSTMVMAFGVGTSFLLVAFVIAKYRAE